MLLKLVKGTLLAAMMAMVVIGCGKDEEVKKPLTVTKRVWEGNLAFEMGLESYIAGQDSTFNPDLNCVQLVSAEVDGVASKVLEIFKAACPATGLAADADRIVSLQYTEVSGGTAGSANYRLYLRDAKSFYGSFSINGSTKLLNAICDLGTDRSFEGVCKSTLGNSRIMSINAI